MTHGISEDYFFQKYSFDCTKEQFEYIAEEIIPKIIERLQSMFSSVELEIDEREVNKEEQKINLCFSQQIPYYKEESVGYSCSTAKEFEESDFSNLLYKKVEEKFDYEVNIN